MTMTRYAIIENASGYIFGGTNAESPEQAAANIDAELLQICTYERTSGPAFSTESGYHVYEVPSDFEVTDGQDQDEIDAVSRMPRAAYLRVIEAA